MKKRSLFKKLFSSSRDREQNGSENAERDYVAEALEARVLFSAAPVEAEFASEAVAEEAPAVNEAQSDGDFAPLEGVDLPSGESNLNETVILSSYENLTRAEIVQIKEAALQDRISGSTGETDPAPEIVSEATDSLADVIEGDAAAGTLDDATLQAFWNEGINRWSDSGISADQLTALQSAEVEVHDLEGNILGATSAISVVIDDDGAGRGWFVDATLEQDEEFAALLESPEGIDLLSVVMHEQGHLIGLDGSEEFDNIMNGIFGEGERRLPADGQADGAVAGSLEGVHDPSTDTWSPTSVVSAPSRRRYHSAVWTGGDMLVWGGGESGGTTDTGGRYDPASGSWTPLSQAGAPAPRWKHTAVWTGNEMIVWGVVDETGGRYDPAADVWQPTSTVGAPEKRSSHTAVWTGSFMVVWGGTTPSCCEDMVVGSGGLYALGHGLDDDGDGFSECQGDCRDADATVFAVPHPIGNLRWETPTLLAWDSDAGNSGSATRYDLIHGDLGALTSTGPDGATCTASDLDLPEIADPTALPAQGAGIYFLVRGANLCGDGTYGVASGGVERTSQVCM